MAILRSLFWFAIFLASAFAFTVLFEHGPSNFVDNSRKEMQSLQKYYNGKLERKKDESDSVGR